jgi:hypothetical protein
MSTFAGKANIAKNQTRGWAIWKQSLIELYWASLALAQTTAT